jgi:hypothetical protein
VIRLGSLAGYSFEGPRVLAGWTPPQAPGVYVILYKPDASRPNDLAVLYVGHADDLSAEGFPFQNPRSACWVKRAGSKYNVHIATLAIPGGTRGHREQVVIELLAHYEPACNTEKFDNAWSPHWIQEYDSPGLTGPLTTPRET